MDKKIAVTNVLNEFRNGANSWVRYPLTPRQVSLVISDGAIEPANAAGCHWLLDIIGTEFTLPAWLKIEDGSASRFYILLKFDGGDGCALSIDYGDTPVWTKEIEFTDFPRPNDGEQWKPLFILGYWGEDAAKGWRPALALCLLSED